MNLDNLKKCGLSEALRLYRQALEYKDEKASKSIENYILNNHSITNYSKLRVALDEIEKLDSKLFTKEIKQELIEVKLCAFNISEHLDPVHIDSYTKIETIVAELLANSRQYTENSKGIKKLLDWYDKHQLETAEN